MIAFKYKNTTKRIKIKTNKKLDDRMSSWLQKVFSLRHQIVGFKSNDGTSPPIQPSFTTYKHSTSSLTSSSTPPSKSYKVRTSSKFPVHLPLSSHLRQPKLLLLH